MNCEIFLKHLNQNLDHIESRNIREAIENFYKNFEKTF